MASGVRESGVKSFENAAERVRELNERVIASSRKAGAASLDAYANLLERLAEMQESAGQRGSEWVSEFAQAQARFTRELAEALPAAARRAGRGASEAAGVAGRQARKVPGAETLEGEVKGVVASEADLPIAGYDKLNVQEIVKRLGRLSKTELATVEAYERKHKDRATVRNKIESLRS